MYACVVVDLELRAAGSAGAYLGASDVYRICNTQMLVLVSAFF